MITSLGYFADASDIPAFDPGADGDCPICDKKIGNEERSARSLMLVGGSKSWFFSYHKACYDYGKLYEIEMQAIMEIDDAESVS